MSSTTMQTVSDDEERGRSPLAGGAPAEPMPWHAIWTRSHCEGLVRDQLRGSGFDVFLPTATAWLRSGRGRREGRVPLFPGYLFIRHALDKQSHIAVLNARGVVRVLGHGWDRPTPIPHGEIDAIQRVVDSGLSVFPHTHQPSAGDRVQILGGPLAGVEGVFLRGRADRGTFVVSISLMQRGVAVELDATQVRSIS